MYLKGYRSFDISRKVHVTYVNASDNVLMIDAKAYEIANTAVLYDADAKLVAAGKSNVLAALTVNDVIEKFVEKDGVISSITAKTLQEKDAAIALTTAKKALADAIVKAEKLVVDNKDVDATTLNAAVGVAKGVLGNEETTTKSFNDAVKTLETAIGVFEKAVADAEKAAAESQLIFDINRINGEGNMAAKLSELKYASFEKLSADQKQEVAKVFVVNRGETAADTATEGIVRDAYNTVALIKGKIDEAIVEYLELLDDVNDARTVAEMTEAVTPIIELTGAKDITAEKIELVFSERPATGYNSIAEIIAVLQAAGL